MEDIAITPAVTDTVTPEVSSTPSERPASMREAFERIAAEPETSESAKPEAATTVPADATTEPGATSPSSPEKKGPIPFDVHSKALDNARAKEREAVAAEWKPYEWAKSVPREKLEHMSNIAQRMTSDPIGFLEAYETELQNHPTYGPQLASRAGRTLAGHRGQSVDVEPKPDMEVIDGAGNVTGLTYSAGRQAEREAWLKKQLFAEVEQRYGPLVAEREQRQKAEQQAADREQAITAKVDALSTEILELLDGQEALTADVLKAMTAHPDWSPRKAALHVRDTAIVTPRITPTTQTQVLDIFKQKAAAQGVDGAGRATATPKRPTNATELAAFMRQQAGR